MAPKRKAGSIVGDVPGFAGFGPEVYLIQGLGNQTKVARQLTVAIQTGVQRQQRHKSREDKDFLSKVLSCLLTGSYQSGNESATRNQSRT
ncbi:hypothetical protein HZ326_19251 [Fusarium oxysporum f. sp. albedinis]|nr:hypothetical protein HZ326_19251 [Fusarium oxysporum f. sp. albedinis]